MHILIVYIYIYTYTYIYIYTHIDVLTSSGPHGTSFLGRRASARSTDLDQKVLAWPAPNPLRSRILVLVRRSTVGRTDRATTPPRRHVPQRSALSLYPHWYSSLQNLRLGCMPSAWEHEDLRSRVHEVHASCIHKCGGIGR